MCESFVTYSPSQLNTGHQPPAMRAYNTTDEQKDRSVITKQPHCLLTDFSNVRTRPIKKAVGCNEAVFVLTDCGAIFSWGSAAISGHGLVTEKPSRIETLAPYIIVDVAAGALHVLCCSQEGKLFSWGRDPNALGHGANVDTIKIPSALEFMNDISVCAVACSQNNSFAITADKSLYVWGSTPAMLGNGSPVASPVPLLNVCLAGSVESVYASPSHAGVISTQGVHLWGQNDRYQSDPARSDTSVVVLPAKLEVGNGNRPSMLALGNSFSLMRTMDGAVYGWGANANGQVGLGHAKDVAMPTRIPSLSARNVVRIEASFTRALCSTDDGKWFAWGSTIGITGTDTQSWSVPHQINEKDLILDDTLRIETLFLCQYANCGFAAFSPISQVYGKDVKDKFLRDFQKSSFNDPDVCDVTIVVNGSDMCVHASKYILCARSKYFRTMFSRDMKESREGEIVMEGTTYNAVFALMRFLHTGIIDIKENNVLGVLQLAMKYDVVPLVAKASIYVESVLNFDNCFTLLIEADRICATDIKERIMFFISQNFHTLGRSDGIGSLPPPLLLDIVRVEATIRGNSNTTASDK